MKFSTYWNLVKFSRTFLFVTFITLINLPPIYVSKKYSDNSLLDNWDFTISKPGITSSSEKKTNDTSFFAFVWNCKLFWYSCVSPSCWIFRKKYCPKWNRQCVTLPSGKNLLNYVNMAISKCMWIFEISLISILLFYNDRLFCLQSIHKLKETSDYIFSQ